MNILGISAFYHDSSACLYRDGAIAAAAQEERFSRKKHDLGWPKNAIEYVLSESQIKIGDVDYVAYYEKPFLKFERLMAQFATTYPRSLPAFLESMPTWLSEKLAVPGYIARMGYKGPVRYIGHHHGHAASAFLVSPFESAAILTMDGVGEWSTTTLGRGRQTRVLLEKEIDFPHSIGLLYSTLTAYLGFRVNNSEYKVMGLAPWGKPEHYEKLRKILRLNSDGSFALDMNYFDYVHRMRMYSDQFVAEFGPARTPDSPVTQFHKDMAASVQKLTEEAVYNTLRHLHAITGEENLCMAGGVALNSVANGKILSNTPFKRIFIQPAAGDAGTAIGAAAYLYHTLLKHPRTTPMTTASLGPHYSDEQIEIFLNENKIRYTRFKSRDELLQTTADLLLNDRVIGWFQGRMEWGPRALGNRSILSNPTNPDMADILNLKVKHREKFRPFAPVITQEDVPDYFDADLPVPEPAAYMLMVYPVKKEKRALIPSVTHVDGSGRLQTIAREQNPLYYDLIKTFGKKSGVPILINTSFNIRGEPIVCTPAHAYRCMMGTGIDALVMGHYLIARADNPKDQWDSESEAKKEEQG